MAATVLSGSGNVSYTNSTGQNVRVVINFMSSVSSMSWAGGSASATNVLAIGRNLAYSNGVFGSGTSQASVSVTSNNMCMTDGNEVGNANAALPTEIMLSSGQTFSAVLTGVYNIVVIPEAG